MSKTNCVNCGAAKEIWQLKCPFCGTTYLNMTDIDFTSDDPVACEFVLPYSKDRVVMTMLARPRLREITMESNPVTVYGYGGRPLCSVNTGYEMNIGIEFQPVERPGSKELFALRKEE